MTVTNLMQEIEKAGGQAKAVELDVSADQESIKRSVDETWAAFGKLDILVRKENVSMCTILSNEYQSIS